MNTVIYADKIVKTYRDNTDTELGCCLLSFQDIATRFGCSPTTVRRVLTAAGVDLSNHKKHPVPPYNILRSQKPKKTIAHRKTEPDTLQIPEGWSQEVMEHTQRVQVLVKRPGIGMVTIDFDLRCFRSGLSLAGKGIGPKKPPVGHGWKQTLVDAAVEWLNSI
jgi:AraC-like DNA-binding protein